MRTSNKGDGVGPAFLLGLPRQGEPILALKGGIHLERGWQDGTRAASNSELAAAASWSSSRWQRILREIIMDGAVVVHHEDAQIFFGGRIIHHACSPSGWEIQR